MNECRMTCSFVINRGRLKLSFIYYISLKRMFFLTVASNLENIQSEAIWSEDAKTWTLPELSTVPTKLPPAAGKPFKL